MPLTSKETPLHKALPPLERLFAAQAIGSQNIGPVEFLVIYEVAQVLLGHGADMNARDWHHKTPLHLASLKGSLDMSRSLIEHGEDVDAQNDRIAEHDA